MAVQYEDGSPEPRLLALLLIEAVVVQAAIFIMGMAVGAVIVGWL